MNFDFLYPSYKPQTQVAFKPSPVYKETKKTIKRLKKENAKQNKLYKTMISRADKLLTIDLDEKDRFINFYKNEAKRLYNAIERREERINRLQHKLDYELTNNQENNKL